MIELARPAITKTGAGWQLGKVGETDIYYLSKNTIFIRSNSVRSLMQCIKKEMPEPRQGGSSSEPRDKEWALYGYEEFMRVALENPHELYETLETDGLPEPPKDWNEQGNTVDFSVSDGDFIDIGRFVTGEPEVFGSMHDGNIRRLQADIYIDLNARVGSRASEMRERMLVIIGVVDWLENVAKIRCQIIGLKTNECLHVETTVKQAHDPLNLNDVATISHGSFIRRPLFRVTEYSQTYESGYGTATRLDDYISDKAPDTKFTKPTIYFSEESIANSRQTASRTSDIIKTVKEQVENNSYKLISEGSNGLLKVQGKD